MWMQALAHTRSTGSIYHHGLHPRRWKKDMFYDAKKSNSALVDIFYLKKWKLTPKLILKATGDSNNLDSFQNHHPSIIGVTGISQLYTCFTPHFLYWSQLRVSGVTCHWRSSKIPLSTRMGPGKPDARAWGTIPIFASRSLFAFKYGIRHIQCVLKPQFNLSCVDRNDATKVCHTVFDMRADSADSANSASQQSISSNFSSSAVSKNWMN